MLLIRAHSSIRFFFFFQAEDGIRDVAVTGVQTCALPILGASAALVAPFGADAQPEGFRVLRARAGSAQLRGPDGGTTPIRGFEGTVPGPVLRVKRGGELRVRLVNELVTDTAIHWHGMRVPNAMDGAVGLTQPAVGPGESLD